MSISPQCTKTFLSDRRTTNKRRRTRVLPGKHNNSDTVRVESRQVTWTGDIFLKEYTVATERENNLRQTTGQRSPDVLDLLFSLSFSTKAPLLLNYISCLFVHNTPIYREELQLRNKDDHSMIGTGRNCLFIHTFPDGEGCHPFLYPPPGAYECDSLSS